MLTAMRTGPKGIAIAVLVASVFTTAACGGSTKKAAPASTLTTLTTDQIRKLLLTDKDDAGFTFDAAQDGTAVTSTQDVVTTGGSACQTFVDAQEALSTKYGTAAEVDRRLTKAGDGHAIEASVMAFPSPAKAAAMISDLTAGLQGCRNLAVNQAGGAVTMAPSAIPELVKSGQAGYIDYLTAGGTTELMAADLVQVGAAVSVVAFVGPVTNDPAALRQMGGTQLAHLSDVQVGRLKNAQGPG
jgi:hypothetical protein